MVAAIHEQVNSSVFWWADSVVCVCVLCMCTQVSKLLPDASRRERRRQPSRGKKMRHLEEKQAVKEYRLGRGRGRCELADLDKREEGLSDKQ